MNSKMTIAPKKKTLISDTRGATLTEYIITVGLIALIALAGFKMFGQKVDAKVKNQAGQIDGI